MSYDIESLKTIEEKQRILKEALDGGYILVFQHDEHVECCTLEITPKGIRAKDKFRLFRDIKIVLSPDVLFNILLSIT